MLRLTINHLIMTKKLFLTMTLLATAATVFVACGDKDDDNEPEVVDLGLPSGTLWAKTNLGAKKVWDRGDCYAWGETLPKTDFICETYKYCNGTDSSLTKYCNDSNCGKEGFTDALTTLEPADDAAKVVLGAGYSMPTEADWDELLANVVWEWTSNYKEHNVSGFIAYKAKSSDHKGLRIIDDGPLTSLYSLSDVHIFFPSTTEESIGLGDVKAEGRYWSSSIFGHNPLMASFCYFANNVYDFSSYGPVCGGMSRYAGCSVRPVKRP